MTGEMFQSLAPRNSKFIHKMNSEEAVFMLSSPLQLSGFTCLIWGRKSHSWDDSLFFSCNFVLQVNNSSTPFPVHCENLCYANTKTHFIH